MATKTQFIVFTLAACLATVAGKCYECNSDSNGDCGEVFNPRNVLESECQSSVGVASVSVSVPGNIQHFAGFRNSTGCLKAVVGDLFGKKHIIRSCYYGDNYNTAQECSSIAPRFGFTQTQSCTVCTSNLCNGSGVVGPLFGLIALIAIFLCKSALL